MALTQVVFIPSRLSPLSTLLMHNFFVVVVVILLFIVDVIRSLLLVVDFRIIFGGKVKSFTESCLPSILSLLFSDSGGDGLLMFNIGCGGDK